MRTRKELGSYLNNLGINGIGVEIGVLRGIHAEHLLNTWKCDKLFLIDLWEETRRIKTYYEMVKYKFKDDKRVEIIKSDSYNASLTIPNKSIDFIYIDADHSFQSVASDLLAWYPKLKQGGMFAGHDYREPGKYRFGHMYGVKPAVDTFADLTNVNIGVTDEGIESTWWFIKP